MSLYIFLLFAIEACYGNVFDYIDISTKVNGPWPCPSSDVCWTNPHTLLDMKEYESISTKMAMWNTSCPHCTEKGYCDENLMKTLSNTCAFINAENLESICNVNIYPTLYTLDFSTLVLGPFHSVNAGLAYCEASRYSCSKHFYWRVDSSSCETCHDVPTLSCSSGYYPKRCIKSISEPCEICNFPVLQNTTMFRYGSGSLWDDCDSILDYGFEDIHFDECAWFMTPKWDTGFCNVECNAGFTMLAESSHYLGHPTCVECSKNCFDQLGKVPPVCNGGNQVVPSDNQGNCISCSDYGIHLPANASWVRPLNRDPGNFASNCQWECLRGFYWDDSRGKCISCWDDLPYCDNAGHAYFMKCTNSSRGNCIYCIFDCLEGQFMSRDIWESDCDCVACSKPILGKTFASKNCSKEIGNSYNTEITPCRKEPCPLGYYVSSNCTMYADVVCSLCTPPQNGKLLISECSKYRDARYGPCPVNKSCDGSSVISQCPLDRVPSNGICICPPGMMFSLDQENTCVPIVCKNGEYADDRTGLCKTCAATMQGSFTMVSPSSDSRVLGLDACYCPSSFFIERNHDNTSIRCWPCGDLDCKLNLFEAQTTCSGLKTIEPLCACTKPPGTMTPTNNADCIGTLKCAENYHASHTFSWENMMSTQEEQYTSIYRELKTPIQWHDVHNSILDRPIKSLILMDTMHSLMLSNDSNIILIKHDEQLGIIDSSVIDMSILQNFNPENILSVPIATALCIHDRPDSDIWRGIQSLAKVWIAFTYEGYCGEHSHIKQKCSSIQMFIFFQKQSNANTGNICYLDMCLALGINYWGSSFSIYGVNAKINKIVLGNLEHDKDKHLYMLLEDFHFQTRSIWKYNLLFNSNPELYLEYDDSIMLVSNTIYDNYELNDIAIGSNGMYALIKESDNKRNILTFLRYKILYIDLINDNAPSTENEIYSGIYEDQFSLLSLFYNILFIQHSNGISIELWNRYLSSSTHKLFHSRGRLLLSNTIKFVYFENAIPKWRFGTWVIADNGYALVSDIQACLPDTLYNTETMLAECSLSPCLRSQPCGQHTYRNRHMNYCLCSEGYAYLPLNTPYGSKLKTCTECQSNVNKYCPGGSSNGENCPKNSVVMNSKPTSINECHCSPGFYSLNGLCTSCIKNSFCPFNGTTIPIQCHELGKTEYNQRDSAIFCQCPPRTFGFTCSPCDENDICRISIENIPLLMLLHIQGAGIFNSLSELKTCTDAHFQKTYPTGSNYVLYTIPEDYATGIQATKPKSIQYNHMLWNWFLIVRKDDSFLSHFSDCIKQGDFDLHSINVAVSEFRPENFRVSENCGYLYDQPGYWEWNGEGENDEECVCIAGYEPISPWNLGFYNLPRSQKCFPCLNGTHRPKRSKSLCIPCSDPYKEHAPYIGMSACICKKGYIRSNSTGNCELEYDTIQQYFPDLIAPQWYSSLSSITIAIVITVSTVIGLSFIFLIIIYTLI